MFDKVLFMCLLKLVKYVFTVADISNTFEAFFLRKFSQKLELWERLNAQLQAL